MTRTENDELLVRCVKELQIDFEAEKKNNVTNPNVGQMNEIKKWIMNSISVERRAQLQKTGA